MPALSDGAGPASETERHTCRNQRLNAPQDETTASNLTDIGAGCTAYPAGLVGLGWGTPRLKNVGGQEAMVKAHGVTVAMVQGHSWVPIRSIGSK